MYDKFSKAVSNQEWVNYRDARTVHNNYWHILFQTAHSALFTTLFAQV